MTPLTLSGHVLLWNGRTMHSTDLFQGLKELRCCCVTNSSKTSCPKLATISCLKISVGWESENGLAAWFWLGIFHEVVIKMLARAASLKA